MKRKGKGEKKKRGVGEGKERGGEEKVEEEEKKKVCDHFVCRETSVNLKLY